MAHDEAGVPVEAAASLFGAGDDPAIDFFSSSFDQDNLQEQSSSSHDLGVATTLFEAGPDESTTSFPKTVSHDPWLSNTSSRLDREFNPEATPGIPLDSQTSYDAPTHQHHEWQDQHGQRHFYDNQTQYTSTYDYASQNQSTDPYAPHNEYHSQTVGQTMDHSTNYSASQHTTYLASQQQLDYASSQTNYTAQQPFSQPEYAPHSYSYDPTPASTQGATYSQAVYNPYVTGVQPNGSLSTVDSGTLETLQSPKDVNAYRPTTLNAYDPPIPSKTRSKIRPAFYATQTPSAIPNGVQYPYTGAPQPSSSLPLPPPTTASVLGAGVPTPVSYSVTAESSSASESLHDDNSSGWTHGTDGAHDASLSSHRSEHGDVFESVSTDHMDTSASSQSNPQYVNAEREPHDVESMSSSYGHNPEENLSIPTGNSVASTSEARPTQHRFKQPLTGDQLSISSTDLGRPSFSPPPLTGSPVEYSQTPQPTAGTGLQNGVANSFADNGLPYDPYAPAHHSRQNSDASHTGSTHSNARASSPMLADPYAPPKPSSAPRKDSTASSIHSSYGRGSFVGVTDTYQGSYVPTRGSQRVQSRQSQHSYDDEYTSRYNYTHDPDLGVADGRPNTAADVGDVGYSNVLAAPTYAPYAPSPSLLGTNDPLGRASARVPVISFGFGGKLVTCFHSAGETASGFDVSLTSRHSTSVQLRILHEVIPASAMDSSASSYPGPLFSDPGASSISLARTVGVGTANNVKAKRALVMTWLAERSEELSRGVAHIPSGSQERHNAEGKLVLIRLLKAMVDNDGQLSGSAAIEWAVRAALVPRLESQGSSASELLLSAEHTMGPSYAPVLSDPNEPSLAVYHLRPSALDRIQEFLVRGERHQAYHYALDERLWAHAMLIASSVDTQAWREVVNEFLHSELSIKSPRPHPGSNAESTVSVTNGRESLRVAYSLFAGQGAAAVQELIPPKAVPASKDSLLAAPTGLHTTPVSPNFPQPALTSMVPPESLAKWQETAAVMAFSQTTGDSAALTALGDYLAANRWFEAAHACYLLSPRTSSLGGVGIPSVRIVLVGCESPSTLRNFNKDLDVTIFSEIVEFALSLSPPKGQDTFGGLPHLQAYKLIRASHLAEMGHVEIANRYCEAIGGTIRASTRGSQFYTPTFIGELKNLSDRLTAAPQMDKTASWISRKMAKPSLDTIGSWLEGRFSKLIVGEGDDGTEPPATEESHPSKPTYGPFSHFSAISSATTSASPSPSPTPHAIATASDMPFGHAHVHIDRASSAMDHLRSEVRRPSPVPRVASASATTTTFAQSFNPASRYRSTLGSVGGVPESEGSNGSEGQELSWWGSSSQDRSEPTPTAATFHKVDEAESGGNFVSLMDDYSPGITPIAPRSSQSKYQSHKDDGEEEDLGFGNSAFKKQNLDTGGSNEEPKKANEQLKAAPSISETKQQSSSWLGRWWNRSSEPVQSGPIKAKLGEETSFVYDKELKRWVNKKAGAANADPTPTPPPPSRPRTASPAPGGPPPKASDSGAPPQTRPASAADMTMPPRRPPRVRSNLVPTDGSTAPGSAPPSAISFENPRSETGLTPPPGGVGIGRPKSSASKRNVRSRYVDVFQQSQS